MLLGRYNEVLLSDFGMTLITQSLRYQSAQGVVGSVSYMAPEQLQGKPQPASDQYDLPTPHHSSEWRHPRLQRRL